MRIYTRTGDRGGTHLAGGARVSKGSARVAVYGDVDELNSVVGVLRSEVSWAEVDRQLAQVQHLLLEVGAFLADPKGDHPLPMAATDPCWLEQWVDEMEQDLSPLRNFVLPGGGRGAALAHWARTVCRRAERGVVTLHDAGESGGAVIPFLNRLSDALFVLARWLNHRQGHADVIWRAAR